MTAPRCPLVNIGASGPVISFTLAGPIFELMLVYS